MPSFDSGGVTIEYLDEGEGPLVVLVHAFASNRMVNWVNTSWVKTLTRSGRRVVALDNRGHGASEKLYDSNAYHPSEMAGDVINLFDHLGAEKAALIGYSMGSRISAFVARAAPERLSALVLSGLAENLIKGVGGSEAIAAALRAPSLEAVGDPGARAFRLFADQTGSDREALAACITATRQTLSETEVAQIHVPTLVVVGSDDPIAGSAEALAGLIEGARAVTLPGREHMSAVGDRGHKEAVLAFLDEHGA